MDIVTQLSVLIVHQNLSIWPPLNLEKWVAFAILKLVTPSSY